MKFGIGQPLRRKEDSRLLTGRGRFIASEAIFSSFAANWASFSSRSSLNACTAMASKPLIETAL